MDAPFVPGLQLSFVVSVPQLTDLSALLGEMNLRLGGVQEALHTLKEQLMLDLTTLHQNIDAVGAAIVQELTEINAQLATADVGNQAQIDAAAQRVLDLKTAIENMVTTPPAPPQP